MSGIQAVILDFGDTIAHIQKEKLQEICEIISVLRGRHLELNEYMSAYLQEWNNRSKPMDRALIKSVVTSADEKKYLWDFSNSLLSTLGAISVQPALIDWLVDIYMNPQSYECFDDVYPMLTELKANGTMLLLISNAFPSTKNIIEALGLECFFEWVFLSFELPFVKPEFEIYRHAVDKANIQIERTIFVDDRWDFVKGARLAGLNALLIERFPNKRSQLRTDTLVLKIRSLNELRKIVLGESPTQTNMLPFLLQTSDACRNYPVRAWQSR